MSPFESAELLIPPMKSNGSRISLLCGSQISDLTFCVKNYMVSVYTKNIRLRGAQPQQKCGLPIEKKWVYTASLIFARISLLILFTGGPNFHKGMDNPA